MAAVKTSHEPETIVAKANGAAGAMHSEVVRLDISDPTFMATAYDTYAAMRERGRVGVVKFAAAEDGEAPDGPRQEMFVRESFFITHYDDVVATLLDDRFSVDPRSRLTLAQREQMPEGPEEI